MTTITREQLINRAQARLELMQEVAREFSEIPNAQMDFRLAEIALASLDADKQELKPAHLANKFYERYPLATFKSDTERAEALGYFMAGAELQCFGEFVKYEELCGDE